MTEIEDKNHKSNSSTNKSFVYKNHYGFYNKFNLHNLNKRFRVKSNQQYILTKYKNVPRYCYSDISFNTIVHHWKKEVADMITNMQKRRYDFVQHAIAHNMWEHQIQPNI